MDKYYEEKLNRGYILTKQDIKPGGERTALVNKNVKAEPVTEEDGPTNWSRLSGRYRTYDEQQEYLANGRHDKKLPPRRV